MNSNEPPPGLSWDDTEDSACDQSDNPEEDAVAEPEEKKPAVVEWFEDVEDRLSSLESENMLREAEILDAENNVDTNASDIEDLKSAIEDLNSVVRYMASKLRRKRRARCHKKHIAKKARQLENKKD